jgi:cell division transport system permease protein
MAAMPPSLIAHRRRPGATSWLIAAACLMMLLAAAAVLALGRAADGLERVAASRLIVQLVEPDRSRRELLAEEAMAELRARRDVTSLKRLGDEEIARLIGPYVGRAGLGDLPVPVLIDATIAPGADVAGLRRMLGQIGPVTVEPAGAGLTPLARLIATLRGIALAVTGIAGLAAGLVAILATRAALGADAATIAILHSLGATDGQVARTISSRIARDAAIGAVLGFLLAVAAIVLLARRVAALDPGLGLIGIGWGGWALLALLPLGVVVLAAGGAHAALLVRLRRTP